MNTQDQLNRLAHATNGHGGREPCPAPESAPAWTRAYAADYLGLLDVHLTHVASVKITDLAPGEVGAPGPDDGGEPPTCRFVPDGSLVTMDRGNAPPPAA